MRGRERKRGGREGVREGGKKGEGGRMQNDSCAGEGGRSEEAKSERNRLR